MPLLSEEHGAQWGGQSHIVCGRHRLCVVEEGAQDAQEERAGAPGPSGRLGVGVKVSLKDEWN